MSFWRRYVPVTERRAKAQKQTKKLAKKGKLIQPVEIDGRMIARSYWGKGWCDHLESFSDYENRLPRGRTYVRNGSVCHIEIAPGVIDALVSGSSLYKVSITIKKLKPATWKEIRSKCAGQIGSMLELLQGRFSDQVMAIVADRENGLFPKPGEMKLTCSCPDWAVMCKHVAAVLYGVGNRLDTQPDLLFLLRGVDAQELIAAEMALPQAAHADEALADDKLAEIFGIDIDAEANTEPAPPPESKPKRKPRAAKAPIVVKEEAPKAVKKRGPSPRKTAPPVPNDKRGTKDAAKVKAKVKPKPKTKPKPTAKPRVRKKTS